MKAFEKWWKTFVPFELNIGDNRNKVKKEYKKAWRAALKMVLRQELIDDDGRFVPSHIIREELGDA